MTRTRIKICGMTCVDEVRAAVRMGVDAIGMILHADSPRLISAEQAREIRAEVPAFVSLVGVFVNAEVDLIDHYAADIGLDLVQLHGDETNEFGCQLRLPFIKAIRVKTAVQAKADVKRYPDARAILLDPYVAHRHGGTGQQLDAALWPAEVSQPLVLAGGLNEANVAPKIAQLSPYAVDFNSGLETAPGRKEPAKIAAAIRAVNGAA